jgi:large subunit ribosomal protein L32
MVPVQRKTRTQTRKGRSHQGVGRIQTVACPNCGVAKRPHVACGECGYVRPGLQLQDRQREED